MFFLLIFFPLLHLVGGGFVKYIILGNVKIFQTAQNSTSDSSAGWRENYVCDRIYICSSSLTVNFRKSTYKEFKLFVVENRNQLPRHQLSKTFKKRIDLGTDSIRQIMVSNKVYILVLCFLCNPYISPSRFKLVIRDLYQTTEQQRSKEKD